MHKCSNWKASTIPAIFLFFILAGGVIHASPEMTIEQIDANNFPFLFIVVKVNESGNPVSDLTASAFSLKEDGGPQTDYFDVTPPDVSGGVRLVDFVFLIDNSGSMGDEIAAVRNNVNAFANLMASSGIDLRLGAVRFGQSSNSGQPYVFNSGNLTADLNTFHGWINQMYASGGTEPGIQAVINAANTFNFRPGSQRHFLLITDEDSDGGNLSSAITLCHSNNITVHGAILCSFGNAYNDYCRPGTSITGVTNGLVFPVAGPYNNILNAIGQSISNTYVVKYRTDNPAFDGQQREVEVFVSIDTETDSDIGYYTPGAGPQILRTPGTIDLSYNAPVAGTPLNIEANITDNIPPGVTGASLFYKAVGSVNYSVVSMNNVSGTLYRAQIPSSIVISPGIQYYLKATDGQLTSSAPPVEPGNNPYNIAVLPNIAPVISHVPVTQGSVGTDITISCEVVDNTYNVASVTLYYRKTGTLIFSSGTMTYTGGDSYEAIVPGSIITSDGVDYYIRATDDFGISSETGMYSIFPAEVNLLIERIEPVQVVFNVDINSDARIDLAKDKETVILVFVNGQGLESLQDNITIEAHCGVASYTYVASPSEYRSCVELEPLGWNYLVIPVNSALSGDYEVNAVIDPLNSIEELDEADNFGSSDVTFKETHGFTVTYVPINRPITYFGYGPIDMTEFVSTANSSSDRMRSLYPIADNDLTQQVTGSISGTQAILFGELEDMLRVWTHAKLMYPATDRAVGIVPTGYFNYHVLFHDAVGLAAPPLPGVLARVNTVSTVEHEIGHTYSLPVGQDEEYGKDCNPLGTFTFGYSIQEDNLFDSRLCLMGCETGGSPWVCRSCYGQLFKEFRNSSTDPELLLVSGFLTRDGSVTWNSLYYLEEGTSTFTNTGDFALQVLNADGDVIGEYAFDVSFELLVDPLGPQPVDTMAFALAIPFSNQVSTMRIVHQQAILSTLDPNLSLLHYAVDLLPDSAFLPMPETNEEHRIALHNTLEAVETMIDHGALRAAIMTLRRGVGAQLSKWLRDDFTEENPLLYDRARILSLLEEVISRLQAQQSSSNQQ